MTRGVSTGMSYDEEGEIPHRTGPHASEEGNVGIWLGYPGFLWPKGSWAGVALSNYQRGVYHIKIIGTFIEDMSSAICTMIQRSGLVTIMTSAYLGMCAS